MSRFKEYMEALAANSFKTMFWDINIPPNFDWKEHTSVPIFKNPSDNDIMRIMKRQRDIPGLPSKRMIKIILDSKNDEVYVFPYIAAHSEVIDHFDLNRNRTYRGYINYDNRTIDLPLDNKNFDNFKSLQKWSDFKKGSRW